MYMHLQEHGCEKYEEYEGKMLKRIEELENFGYQVIKALSPEQYIIRRGHEYVEFKVDSKKQIIEISFNGVDFNDAAIGLDIFVDDNNSTTLILYFLEGHSCDERYIKLW